MPKVPELLDSLIERITAFSADNGLREDARHNLKALIQSAFSNLDLVTREEFEAQLAVLNRTRAKIEQLEQQLQVLSQTE